MTHEEVYKYYKHGGMFPVENVSTEKVFGALKLNGLQVVMVRDSGDKDRVYVYHPETDKFEWIC